MLRRFLRLAAKYAARHIKSLILYFTFTAIFAAVFFLARLPLDTVGYAALLCLFVLFIFCAVDFWQFYRRHTALLHARDEISLTPDCLPPPSGFIEEDYAALIRQLCAERGEYMARAASSEREKLDFYTLWTHQIKTPLTALKLMLCDCTMSSDERSAFGDQLDAVERYTDIVLGYIKLDGGGSDLVLRETDISSAVRASVRDCAKLFIKKKISLDVGEISLYVISDEKWLSFVISQVLINSLKYTKSGGSLDIFTAESVPDAFEDISPSVGGKILCIRDSGIGIPAEDIPRVFDKGYTGLSGRTDKKSTGIGLYLCRRVCDMLGHRIAARSRVGVGTAIFIDLRQKNVQAE